jgi:hypothetical protein
MNKTKPKVLPKLHLTPFDPSLKARIKSAAAREQVTIPQWVASACLLKLGKGE